MVHQETLHFTEHVARHSGFHCCCWSNGGGASIGKALHAGYARVHGHVHLGAFVHRSSGSRTTYIVGQHVVRSTSLPSHEFRGPSLELNKQIMASKHNEQMDMAFTATNYKLLLIGLAIVVVGFMLMAGGGNGDPNSFNEADIFSPRRITVAPIVTLIGYLFVVYAILKKTGGSEA